MNFKPKMYRGFHGYPNFSPALGELKMARGFVSTAFKPPVTPEMVAREFATTPSASTQIAPAPIQMNPVLRVARGDEAPAPQRGELPLSLPDLTTASESLMREATGLRSSRIVSRQARTDVVVVERPALIPRPPSTEQEATLPDSRLTDSKTRVYSSRRDPAPTAERVVRDFEAGATTKTPSGQSDALAAKSAQEFAIRIPTEGIFPDVRVGLEADFRPSASQAAAFAPKSAQSNLLPVVAAGAGFALGGPLGAIAGAILGSFLGKK